MSMRNPTSGILRRCVPWHVSSTRAARSTGASTARSTACSNCSGPPVTATTATSPFPDRNDWIGRLPGYFRKRLYKRLRPGDNPYFRTLPPLEKGSNWIVVTDRFRDFVFDYLRTHPDYIRAFRHSHCGDEIFFQTLMGISEFAGANTRRPLVFTRWVGEGAPHPETFGTNDLPRLLQARDTAAEVPYLFARKIADDLDIARYRAAFFPRPE